MQRLDIRGSNPWFEGSSPSWGTYTRRMPNEVYTRLPDPGIKLTKEEAGYVARGPFSCATCMHFEKPETGDVGACQPVGGAVSAHGCCNYWNVRNAPHGVGKSGVEYVCVQGSNYTCAQCRFFASRSETCSPVKGRISPVASCDKWMP